MGEAPAQASLISIRLCGDMEGHSCQPSVSLVSHTPLHFCVEPVHRGGLAVGLLDSMTEM